MNKAEGGARDHKGPNEQRLCINIELTSYQYIHIDDKSNKVFSSYIFTGLNSSLIERRPTSKKMKYKNLRQFLANSISAFLLHKELNQSLTSPGWLQRYPRSPTCISLFIVC
jgi:hypothetical protein